MQDYSNKAVDSGWAKQCFKKVSKNGFIKRPLKKGQR